jgi:RND superfamily putative drug exporter
VRSAESGDAVRFLVVLISAGDGDRTLASASLPQLAVEANLGDVTTYVGGDTASLEYRQRAGSGWSRSP